ncbi:MAG TPA: penicillin-binding protein 2, partial [Vicinamibacterales bacterium]|nr:penicillin-binding protein 2 [Vicinamibacterales bacterium]
MNERGADSGRQPAADWRATLKRRVIVAASLLGLWAVGIEAKLVALQVFERADLVKRAESQQQRTFAASAQRGDILDRKGRLLATSVDADSIYAVSSGDGDHTATVGQLCDALEDCTPKERQGLLDRLSSKKWSWVRRQVSPDTAERVKALNLEGIGFMKESARFYPNRELAAHVLGWVGVDNNGLSGIESAYDSQIRGKDGKILVATDAKRHAFDRMERPPTPGSSIELTIDEYLQHIAERELHAGVVENHAAGGSAIIMNPHTGEILAMANEPTFNPNDYRSADDAERRNRAVQDLYEPGSTFKLVTASAAVENKVIPLDAMVETSPGYIRVGANIIHDTENHGTLSFSDVIADSSNVGAAKIGLKVGADRLVEYVRRFGFGHSASPDFLSESPGIVWAADKLGESALAHVSIGYQVAVTPLQMISAVSSIANGGQYVEPRVVRAVYRDGRRYVVSPKVLRESISADTAATLTAIMEGVVDHGTATAAQIKGFTIAGKTGTAAKLVNHRYSNSEYNASFVGFLPSRDPVVSIIVVIDSPHGKGYYGGVVSAPIFKRIAEAAVRYMGVGPSINPAEPVIVARKTDTTPLPTSAAASPDSVVSLVADGPIGTMPDLTGMSARDAMR